MCLLLNGFFLTFVVSLRKVKSLGGVCPRWRQHPPQRTHRSPWGLRFQTLLLVPPPAGLKCVCWPRPCGRSAEQHTDHSSKDGYFRETLTDAQFWTSQFWGLLSPHFGARTPPTQGLKACRLYPTGSPGTSSGLQEGCSQCVPWVGSLPRERHACDEHKAPVSHLRQRVEECGEDRGPHEEPRA